MLQKEQKMFANDNCSLSGLVHFSIRSYLTYSGLIWPFLSFMVFYGKYMVFSGKVSI